MPAEVLDAMNAQFNAAINSPATSAKLRNNGLEPLTLTRTEMNRRVNDEARFMKDFLAKIKLDFQT
jgi:tripartite-type tricarboxylate transporter receptor subunit TctC